MKYKVLLVEDIKLAQLGASIELKKANCEVEVASTGEEALKKIQKTKYDMVFLDIGLPDVSGFEISQQIKNDPHALNSRTPILALTAHISDDIKSKAFESGMDDFLVKPLTQDLIENSIQTHINKQMIQWAELDGFKVYYDSRDSMDLTYDELFVHHEYSFESNKERPFIIDAGSNIGLATFYFKKHFPNARILCFEPNPQLFEILARNVKTNDLQTVTLVNKALFDSQGEVSFYGEFPSKSRSSLANSIQESWGCQRHHQIITVQTTQLSKYIKDNEEVDFLKLDVEGVEQRVLQELGDKLQLIRQISLEVHLTDQTLEENNLQTIEALLKKHGFDVVMEDKHIQTVLPSDTKDWVETVNPQLWIVKAYNKKFSPEYRCCF
ncbi:MAG: FkbM family methyltransferase [Pseudomonadota bacterium]|nr:FkbM family methyltransferase [Gammaproteobacteria bacterium]